MENEKEQKQEINAVDALFDPNNEDNIVLYNDKDEAVEFEQIAIIPIDNVVYAILRPVEKLEGIAEDEAFVFEVVEDEEEGDTIHLVENEKLIEEVFAEYNKMFDEAKK